MSRRSRAKQCVRADLVQIDGDWRFLAAILYFSGKGFERRQVIQWMAAIGGFKRHDMNETHTIVELKCGVAQPGWLLALELFKHAGDVALIFKGAISFDFVADHHSFHDRSPSIG